MCTIIWISCYCHCTGTRSHLGQGEQSSACNNYTGTCNLILRGTMICTYIAMYSSRIQECVTKITPSLYFTHVMNQVTYVHSSRLLGLLNVNVAYKRALPAPKIAKNGGQSEQYVLKHRRRICNIHVPVLKHGTIRMND